jgi:hypothetical protein
LTNELGVELKYEWFSDVEMNFNEYYDLSFIDTLHVYGQLKRELTKYSKITNKYIIMHDTTVDEIHGEIIRIYPNQEWYTSEAQIISKITNIPENELLVGLWPAIEEFLNDNPEWSICERFTNNNGLTILQKS